MAPALTLKDVAQEAQLFRSRAVIAGVFVVALMTALAARMFQLQVVEYEHFKTLSEDNRVKIVPVGPTRGLIFDRNGRILAQNTPTFSLEVVPEAVRDMDALIADLRGLMEISEADEQRFRAMLGKKRRFESVPLRLRLNPREVARFSVNRHLYPGVDVEARLTRNYPLGPLAVHLVGYVGRIDELELARIDAANYRGTTHIGKTGVEHAYETLLHGAVGYQHVETNALGRTLRVLERRDPIPGASLYLTIDADLQAEAERALGDNNGAIVAIEPESGAVLAFASMPTFDPNLFVDGIDHETYKALLSSPDRPLFNRTLNGQYPPGSTIKPFMALAGLESEVEDVHAESWCGGYFQLPGKLHRYRDWKRGGHGKIRLHRAIVESCDVFFYQLALSLGIERMHDFMTRFGFGRKTGVDLSGESAGLMPSSEWKLRTRNVPWYPGETLITGIGQGFTLATPLQLAAATATLAMRGVKLEPRVALRREDPLIGLVQDFPPQPADADIAVEPEHWQAVIDAMVDVVHGKKGTARRIGVDATYRMAGKTGTAQVFNVAQDEEYDEEKIAKELRDHGLFIAFAPVEKPRISIAVVVEHGGSGSRSAAPVARRVLDYYLRDSDLDAQRLITTREPPAMTARIPCEAGPCN